MNNNPLKSVIISGPLFQKQLTKKIPLEYFQIYCGVWRVSIADIRFSIEELILQESCFEICSNLVQGLTYSENGPLKKFFVPLQTFQISKKDSQPLVFHFPNLQWFHLSDPDENIIVELKQWPISDEIQSRKIQISIRFLFERIV